MLVPVLLPLVQISHIPHANILNFVAAEIIQRNSQTFHHLICEYHERGTLFDHLQATCIDVHGLLVLAESVAAGLAHLHSEVPNNQGVLVKPAIALCNLSSRNIYVKMDGECIAVNTRELSKFWTPFEFDLRSSAPYPY